MAGWEWAVIAAEIVVLPPLLWWQAGGWLTRMGWPTINWSGPWTEPYDPLREMRIAAHRAMHELAARVGIPPEHIDRRVESGAAKRGREFVAPIEWAVDRPVDPTPDRRLQQEPPA